MKITFLGNGGGRSILRTFHTSTGGFVIENHGDLIIVDPGIDSFRNFHRAKLSAKRIVGIIVTHNHLDHINDLLLYIEAASENKEKPVLLSSRNVLIGDEHYDKFVSSYHQGKADCRVGEPGQEHELAGIRLRLTKIKHDEYTGFGLNAEAENLRIGYTGDTEMFEGLGEQFTGVDLLIANNLKPNDDGIPDHLDSNDTIAILKTAKPKLCMLYHMGMTMFRVGPKQEAIRIQNESGVRTFPSMSFMTVNQKLEVNFVKHSV